MTVLEGDSDLRFYFGGAAGSARKALQQMQEPDVMISAVTQNNQPWEEIDNLFVDSGGYSMMLQTGEHNSTKEYLDYVERVDAKKFAVQDYPCEPDILDEYGRSVRQHQEMTIEAAAENIVRANERGLDATPANVVQGWQVDDYVRHVERMKETGTLTEHLGIGSICRRGQAKRIVNIIEAVDDATPEKTKLHAFGVKKTILEYPSARQRLHSADSSAWYFRTPPAHSIKRWQAYAMHYGQYLTELSDVFDNTGKVKPNDDAQKSLAGGWQ